MRRFTSGAPSSVGMDPSDAHRLKELEGENGKPKKLLAEAHLDITSLFGDSQLLKLSRTQQRLDLSVMFDGFPIFTQPECFMGLRSQLPCIHFEPIFFHP